MVKLTDADYAAAAARLRCSVAHIKAVATVESKGGGFLEDGRLVIRFEGHWFRKLTKGKYDKTHPDISHPYDPKGTRNKGPVSDYLRLKIAMSLDTDAALLSTSWGKWQVMGFNASDAGYTSVHTMIDDYKTGEGAQLLSFCTFVINKHIDDELREGDFDGFAYIYNGPNYGDYAIKMRKAFRLFGGKI